MSPYDQKVQKNSMSRHQIHSYKLPLNLTAFQLHIQPKIQDLFPCGQITAFWSQYWDMVCLAMLLHLVPSWRTG